MGIHRYPKPKLGCYEVGSGEEAKCLALCVPSTTSATASSNCLMTSVLSLSSAPLYLFPGVGLLMLPPPHILLSSLRGPGW